MACHRDDVRNDFSRPVRCYQVLHDGGGALGPCVVIHARQMSPEDCAITAARRFVEAEMRSSDLVASDLEGRGWPVEVQFWDGSTHRFRIFTTCVLVYSAKAMTRQEATAWT